MKPLWLKISLLGLEGSISKIELRNRVLTNQLNFVLLVLMVLITIATSIYREINDGLFTIHTQKLAYIGIVCAINVWLAYKTLHNFQRFNLIVFPPLIGVFLPIFLGYAQNDDFYFAPLLLLGFSLFPATILMPNFRNKWYLAAFLFFLAQMALIDNALVYFSTTELDVPKLVEHIHFYYKLALVSVFVFIYVVIYYHRRMSLQFEADLRDNNSSLQNSLQELKATQEKLVQSEKMASLGVLTAGVAHEINNPLNYIMGGYIGLTDHFKGEGKLDNENISFFLDSIKTGIDRASEIVKSLGQFSRGNQMKNETCDLHHIMDNCLIMLNGQAKEKVQFVKKFHPSPILVQGNIGKLHQVFINVLVNAIHAIEKNGLVTVSSFTNQNRCTIEINDNGCGIAAENLNKITDPFFTTKEPGKGTGLGLSITYAIVKEHKGELEINSKRGLGTTVKLTFPSAN
jgi:signal transduction histidine kinase